MLKLKHLTENFKLATHCIAYWEHDADTLGETLRYFRISSNAVYPFRQGKGLCFLRLCPAEEKALAAVESEVAVIRWLRAEGFPAMEPVPMKDGRFCAALQTPWGRYTASCFRQVAGQPLEQLAASPGLVEGYGRCLGQLHHTLQRCPCGVNRPDHRGLLAEAEQRLVCCHAPQAVLLRLAEMHKQLDRLPAGPEAYGLIHYDFEPDNVFCHPETRRYAVIDFDDMIFGWHALDVVRALDGLDDLPDGPVPMTRAEKEALFLTGYRTCHPFTPEEEASLPLMRRLVSLVEYAGLLYALREEVPGAPDWMQQLRRRLTARVHALEQMLLA